MVEPIGLTLLSRVIEIQNEILGAIRQLTSAQRQVVESLSTQIELISDIRKRLDALEPDR